MTKARAAKGRQGEELAVRHLTQQGYRIIQQNYRVSCGEIDIVAQDKGVWVFVEVKTRTSSDFGTPAEAVTFRKRQQISKAALVYLEQKRLVGAAARFDVVAILLGQGTEPRIELIKNAFDLSYEG